MSAPLTLLTVTEQAHNQQIGELRGQIAEVRQDMNGRFEQVDQRFSTLEQGMRSGLKQAFARGGRFRQKVL